MKRRVQKILNFSAFNLLFFAIYLNFIHKDNNTVAAPETTVVQKTPALTGSVLVNNPEKYLDKKSETATAVSHIVAAN